MSIRSVSLGLAGLLATSGASPVKVAQVDPSVLVSMREKVMAQVCTDGLAKTFNDMNPGLKGNSQMVALQAWQLLGQHCREVLGQKLSTGEIILNPDAVKKPITHHKF